MILTGTVNQIKQYCKKNNKKVLTVVKKMKNNYVVILENK